MRTSNWTLLKMETVSGIGPSSWAAPASCSRAAGSLNDIKQGQTITATVNPLRDDQPGGLLGRVTLPDGRELPNGPGR